MSILRCIIPNSKGLIVRQIGSAHTAGVRAEYSPVFALNEMQRFKFLNFAKTLISDRADALAGLSFHRRCMTF